MVTTTVPVPEQPPEVPVTEYVVVVVGETLTVVPLKPPGFHVYVVAPLPVNVVDDPEQTVGGAAVAETMIEEFTVTVTMAVPVHAPEVPVIV